MTAVRKTQVYETPYVRPNTEDWRKQRMELLEPQKTQRTVRKRREGVTYLMVAVLVFCSAFGYMSLDARINTAGREVNLLQQQIAAVENNGRRIELEIGNLSALARIEDYATENLGMVYPELTSVQYLDQQIGVQVVQTLAALEEQAAAQAATAAVEEPQPVEKRNRLFTAWADLIAGHFTGTALAAQTDSAN